MYHSTSSSNLHQTNNFDPLHFLNQRNYGTYNRILARKIGCIEAVLLSELIEIRSYNLDNLISNERYGDGWIYASHVKITERTGLTDKEMRTAINNLKRLGLIEVVVFGIPATRHFRIIDDAVLEIFQTFSKNDSSLSKRANWICQKGKLDMPKGQTEPRAHTYKEPKKEPKEDTHPTLSNCETTEDEKFASECVSFFLSKIKQKDPKFKLSLDKQKKWCVEFLKFHLDRTWEEIHELISISQSHPFWASRTLTPSNLFKHATTILTESKIAPIEDNAKIKDKQRQDIIDRNTHTSYMKLKPVPAKFYLILADKVKMDLKNGQTITINLDDPKFEEKINLFIERYEKEFI